MRFSNLTADISNYLILLNSDCYIKFSIKSFKHSIIPGSAAGISNLLVLIFLDSVVDISKHLIFPYFAANLTYLCVNYFKIFGFVILVRFQLNTFFRLVCSLYQTKLLIFQINSAWLCSALLLRIQSYCSLFCLLKLRIICMWYCQTWLVY